MALLTAPLQGPLITTEARRSAAVYVDVNPAAGEGRPMLLYGAVAVWAAIRNLLRSPPGDRSRIFEPDYGSGLYHLLWEPYSEATARAINIAIFQAVQRLEPRITLRSSDISVSLIPQLPGYAVTLSMKENGRIVQFTQDIKLS